jgi:RNA polymerase sigma-70 factor (ECF subfamily)
MEVNKDSELVRKLRESETPAFDQLYCRYHNKVYFFALRLHLSEADAEELVQEVFCAVWKNRTILDPDQNFSAYLFGIAHNQAHTMLRKKVLFKRYLNYLEIEPEKKSLSIEEQIDIKEIESFLHHLIQMMPPRRRQIFYMSRFEELTYRQITEKLNISENTVDTQIRQALNFLRSIFLKK